MTSLVLAYSFAWAAIFVYMLFLQRKQRQLERELEMVRELVER